MEDNVWKYACLRDLQVSDPGKVPVKWIKLYACAFDGSHSYLFHQQEKHIDWMRIGAFSLDSPEALLADSLIYPKAIPDKDDAEKLLETNGLCVLNNIKTGIWIADLQLVRCPVCDLSTCDGTMQTLDARHIELFLSEGFQDGSWEYSLLGSHESRKTAEGAIGTIIDLEHLRDSSTAKLFDTKSWIAKENDWQPKVMTTPFAVAVCTKLQPNDGLHVKYHILRAGAHGKVMSIRISQQLL
ncbi:hypothetical protein Droror1_Dr00027430 [Drosera rotundifolia]